MDPVETKMIVPQPKWKSKYFWAAIVSVIAFILGNWGLYDAIGLTSETFQRMCDLVFTAITALGIWNDAGNKEEY